MSQQITVSISGDITALVTYHYPPPFTIDFIEPYNSNSGYRTSVIDGAKHEFDNRDALGAFFQERLPSVSIAPAISNILLLKSKYKPKAECIYGTDLKLIQSELDKLPRKRYEDVQELINDCLPVFDY